MKKMGLIGGMSWESTELYYRNINTEIKNLLGGHHSARLVLESVDFQEVKDMQHRGDWEGAAKALIDCAKNLEKSEADFIMICTNTMHKVAPQISEAVKIPIIHLADATAENIIEAGYTKVGFLGTKFSMEDDFYIGRLKDKYNLEVFVPNEKDRNIVHDVIYDQLCLGEVLVESRIEYLRIMDELHNRGVECIIEGCTEIVMLVDQNHTDIPLFDTTAIHAQKAAQIATS
jgi:aspartate racemase